MLTFVVMPCLDEAEYVTDAIESLLQQANDGLPEAHIIVVDNGSTDGTQGILEDARLRHRSRIHLVCEARRGYVPPRRRGVELAEEIAASLDVTPHDVLVLQADADTIYRRGYVAAMRKAAIPNRGAMFEGATSRPLPFELDHATYVAAERLVDEGIEGREAADDDDVVVDDKVCGYWLDDYLRWGGLFEELTEAGDPIHAETTRLFIRARLLVGTSKIRVNPAGAFPSRRRIVEDPRYHFATLGFPREGAWAADHSDLWHPVDIDVFAQNVIEGRERDAVALRRAHLIALFRYLPALVIEAGNPDLAVQLDDDISSALRLMTRRTAGELIARPSLAIMDVLGLIDQHPNLFG